MDPARAPHGVTRHRLSAASFSTLSLGDGSPQITRDFWITEESRRLLLISTLLQEIERDPALLGPLPPVAEVVGAVAEAQRAAPSEVRELLLDPEVGSACAYALRRLRGGARSDAPLWLDLGVVHAVALAAAARAGLRWSTRLPLRGGNVMIPAHGMARFSDAGATPAVEADAEGGRIRLSDGRHELLVPGDGSDVDSAGAGAAWWALRRITVGDDVRLTVWLDDLDPLRDLADPVPPARLDPEAFRRWHRLIGDAWALLCRDYRPEAEAMAAGVVSIVPLKHEPGWDTRSASNGEAFGSVMLSEPPDAMTMAVSLIHEYQHIKLGALLHLIRLTEPDDGSLYYAPWRDDPRPLAGLIQGVYAFFGITKFWRTRRDKAGESERGLAAFEYAYARQQTVESVQIALSAPGLTAAGRQLFEGLRKRLDEWSSEPGDAVDPRIAQLATITAESHRIGWRLRHFRPRDEDVVALAGRLARRSAPPAGEPVPAAIRPHARLRWEQRIPAVARRQARTVTVPAAGGMPPDRDPLTGGEDAMLARTVTTPAGGTAPPARDALTVGENALLARDAHAARVAFAGAIGQHAPAVRDPRADVPDEETRAWAGLAMSLAAAGDAEAATALRRRPDLVRAVYTESRAAADSRAAGEPPAAPTEVAVWLATAFTGAGRSGPED